MQKATTPVVETPVVKEVKPASKPAPKKISRKVPAGTLKKFTNATKKAKVQLDTLDTTAVIVTDAEAGIKAVRALVKKANGKFSPLGHLIKFQNGKFDEAILSSPKADFGEWVKIVAKAECKSRKTKVTDTLGLITRLKSHLGSLSGVTPAKAATMTKRLANVGLADKAEEIMGAFAPVRLYFEEYVAAGKFN